MSIILLGLLAPRRDGAQTLADVRHRGRLAREMTVEMVGSGFPHDPLSQDAQLPLIAQLQLPGGMSAAALRERMRCLYADSGIQGFRQLRFPFAVVLWDRRRECLVAIRDQLGVMPLFYSDAGGPLRPENDSGSLGDDLALVAVSNSLRLLGQVMPSQATVDDAAVADLLLGTFPRGTATIARGLHQLPAGHGLEIDRDGRSRLTRYWDISEVVSARSPRALRARDHYRVRNELRDLLTAAVRSAIPLDAGAVGPSRDGASSVGCFFSGGLDSTLVAALACQELAARGGGLLTTLSLRFPGFPEADEGRYLAAFHRRWRTSHHDLPFTGIDPLGHLPALNRACGEPMLMGNHVYSWLLAGLAASAGCRVALTGHDGDTVFGYRSIHPADLLRSGHGLRALSAWWLLCRHECQPRRLTFLASIASPLMRRLKGRLGMMPVLPRRTTWALADLLERTGAWERAEAQWAALAAQATSASQEHQRELSSLSLRQATTFMAQVGMEHDLEIRHPLLQVDVVEYCAALPAEAMLHGGWSRHALRQVLAALVPRELAWRRRKANLSRPLYQALADHAGASLAAMLDASSEIRTFVRPEALSALRSRMLPHGAPLSDDELPGLWQVVWLAEWLATRET